MGLGWEAMPSWLFNCRLPLGNSSLRSFGRGINQLKRLRHVLTSKKIPGLRALVSQSSTYGSQQHAEMHRNRHDMQWKTASKQDQLPLSLFLSHWLPFSIHHTHSLSISLPPTLAKFAVYLSLYVCLSSSISDRISLTCKFMI